MSQQSSNHPVVHFELPYQDQDRLNRFYSVALGWQLNQLGPEMGDYILAGTTAVGEDQRPTTPGAINGGFYPAADGPSPILVVGTDDIAASTASVEQAGGTVLGEPMDITGVGRFVIFEDTEGNRLTLLQPNMP